MSSTQTVGVSLRSKLSGAAAWVVVGAGASQVLRLLANLLATRLLMPDLFGLVAFAGLAPMVLAMLSDIGVRDNICRSPNGEDQRFLDTIWTVQIIRSVLIWVGCLFISLFLYLARIKDFLPPGSTYADPRLPWVIAVSSFTIITGGFHSTKVYSENRKFQIKALLGIELISQIAGLVVMLFLAWLTRSIWALLLSSIVSSLMFTIFSHTRLPGKNNSFAWDRTHLNEVLTFGRWIFWSSVFTVFAGSADRLILGGVVSPADLGFYAIAVNLVGAVDTLAAQIFGRVAMPGFSEIVRNDPKRLSAAYFKVRSKIDPIFLILSGVLFASGHLIVDILYDGRYKTAGPMLEILALGFIVSRYSLAQSVYLANNRPQYQVYLNVVRCIWAYVTLYFGYSLLGMTGVLLAVALRELPSVPMILYFNSKHQMNHWGLELRLLLVWPLAYGATVGLSRLISS